VYRRLASKMPVALRMRPRYSCFLCTPEATLRRSSSMAETKSTASPDKPSLNLNAE
jgi:hypothetical protein